MQINEPARAFKDFDAIVEILGEMQTPDLRVLPMTKVGQAIRSAGFLSSVRIITKSYSLMMYFTLTGLVLEEFGFNYIPRKVVKNTDLKEFNTYGHKIEFILRKGCHETYKLKEDRIVIDLDDLRNSTPELFTEEFFKSYRIIDGVTSSLTTHYEFDDLVEQTEVESFEDENTYNDEDTEDTEEFDETVTLDDTSDEVIA